MASQKALVIDLNEGSGYQRLLGGLEKEPKTRGMRSGKVSLQPKEDCGRHSTDKCEELLVFLAGSGSVLIGEAETLAVGKGKICYIPPHTTHNIVNSGTEPLVYVYCVGPVAEQPDG